MIEHSVDANKLKSIIKTSYNQSLAEVANDIGLNQQEVLKNVLSNKIVKIENEIANNSSVSDVIAEVVANSFKMKEKVERISSFSGEKLKVIQEEDVFDIIENEEKSKKDGLSITDSVEIKRASIIKDNIHITLDYPLKSVTAETLSDLEDMKKYFPNFKKVIDDVMGYVSLSLLGKTTYFYMKPILLAGDPGFGKTAFAKRLAKILGLGFKKLPFTTVSASWVITGLDLSWNGGKAGKLFSILSQTEMANPIIFLDELDKAKNSDTGGNPLDTLHDLLEKETSVEVLDEALNLYMNASKINWIATANNLERIPESILSRFQIFDIKDVENNVEKHFVIRNVFENIIEDLPNKDYFNNKLSDDICNALEDKSIRVVNNLLSRAIGKAAKRAFSDGKLEDVTLIINDLSIDD